MTEHEHDWSYRTDDAEPVMLECDTCGEQRRLERDQAAPVDDERFQECISESSHDLPYPPHRFLDSAGGEPSLICRHCGAQWRIGAGAA